MKFYTPILLLFILAFSECRVPPPAEVSAVLPGRRDLIRSARRDANWLWVYAASDSIQAKAYRELLAPVVANPPFGQKISLRAMDEVSAEDLARHPIFLLGSSFSEEWQAKINRTATLQLKDQQFSFAGESFTSKEDLFQLFYHPNPWNTSWPMHLMLANEDDYLIAHLKSAYQDDWSQLFWSSWGYTVLQEGFTRFLGYFADSTWVLDRKVHFAFSPHADTLLQSPVATWIGHDVSIADTLLQTLQREHLARRDSLQSFLGESQMMPLAFHLYPSVEQKGLGRQNMEPAEGDTERSEVHLVANHFFRGDHAAEDIRILLQKRLGQPEVNALETGLTLQFAPAWGEKGYSYWAGRIYGSEHLFTFTDLIDNERMETVSSLLFAPSSAALVAFLIDRYGKETFLEQYQTWRPSPDSIRVLEKEWQQYLAGQYGQLALEKKRSIPSDFLRGYTFAHEGYRIYNGFGSQAARSSLEELQILGTDAVSIVPYSFMSDPKVASLIPIVKRAGTENDPATLFAHFSAKELGMFSLLKPQIWVRGSWPGDIDFATEEEWELFFEYYDRWMTHYVMLAEMYGFDGIAVGTELAQSTIKHPEQWREMLGRWRKLYRGNITYAANWGEEIEQIAFWPELDFIGCNCYYPLATDSTNVSLEALTTGANAMLDKVAAIAKQASKPIWLTEIGYRSVTGPWRNPHAEANGRPYNGEHQALAYEALFESLQQHPEVKGIFWWKWPSYLDYSPRRKTGFTPLGKPAEKVVQKWFGILNEEPQNVKPQHRKM